ncbi:MAG: SWIM zinc finger family protein, partial [Bacillota bacterium]
MSSKKFIKNLVSNKIYKRGIDYYQQGLVLQYRIKKIEANLYQISAQVSGDKKYNVRAKVSLSETEVEFDSHCDCPYDWESYCKHEIAVLYKFMQEDFNSTKVNYEAEFSQEISDFKAEQKDFQSNLVEQKIADRSFKNLLEFSKNYD